MLLLLLLLLLLLFSEELQKPSSGASTVKKYGIQLEDVEIRGLPRLFNFGDLRTFLESGIQSKLTTSIGSKNNTRLPVILPYLIQVALKSTKYSQVLVFQFRFVFNSKRKIWGPGDSWTPLVSPDTKTSPLPGPHERCKTNPFFAGKIPSKMTIDLYHK